MSGPYLARSQKLAVQHFTLEVNNLFTKATIFIPVFRLLLVMLTRRNGSGTDSQASWQASLSDTCHDACCVLHGTNP